VFFIEIYHTQPFSKVFESLSKLTKDSVFTSNILLPSTMNQKKLSLK